MPLGTSGWFGKQQVLCWSFVVMMAERKFNGGWVTLGAA
jgi:hypothetical protein